MPTLRYRERDGKKKPWKRGRERQMLTAVWFLRETQLWQHPASSSSHAREERQLSQLSVFFSLLITAFNHQTCLIVAQSDICGALMYTNKLMCDAYRLWGKKNGNGRYFCCDTSGDRICMGVTSVNWLMGLITVKQSQHGTKVHARQGIGTNRSWLQALDILNIFTFFLCLVCPCGAILLA